MRSIAVLNLKGGSGKSTTALGLAAGAARRGLRVLAVDSDPQANATLTLLDGRPAETPTLGDVLLGRAGAGEGIRPTRVDGLDVLPADGGLADAALLLADQIGREYRLAKALAPVEGGYDLAVVDCPPTMSLLTVNVLAAVGELVVPVDPGVYSVAGLGQLRRTVDQVRDYLNPRLRIAGLVVTRAHPNRATRDVVDQLREAFGPLVYRSVIPHGVKVEEAHARHLTVAEFAPRAAPAVAYEALVDEVLEDGHNAARDAADGRVADPEPAPAGPRAGRGRSGRRAG